MKEWYNKKIKSYRLNDICVVIKSGKDGKFYMRIYIVPIRIEGIRSQNVAVRLRKGETPVLFMQNAQVIIDGLKSDPYRVNTAIISVLGDIEDGVALQDGDILLIQAENNPITQSVKICVKEEDNIYMSEDITFNAMSIASIMEKHICIIIADTKSKNIISTSVQIFNRMIHLYAEFPAYKNIMIKDSDGNAQEMSLLSLIMTQDDNFVKWAETMILSMDSRYKTEFPVAKQILEQTKTSTGFSLLSKEEQVAAFLEFSRKHTDNADEMVPDKLLDYLRESPEYAASLNKLKQAGLGESKTQQFNVLQQVGYFGGRMREESGYREKEKSKNKVIYNLSDMGAGKTLMTVQAIFMIDCINIGKWNRTTKKEYVNVVGVYLPDKHIIAPALSVKSSWIDTFMLFYDVEKDTDYHYILSMDFDGVTAISHLYVSPFTVRSEKVYVQETLPEPTSLDTYLIIDEIHQLVRRRISRTKFFVPKINPVDTYRIFALSGTMSNLKSDEWLSMIRFLGDTNILENASESKKKIEKLYNTYMTDICDMASNLETYQHRKFNVDDVTVDNIYTPNIKKKSSIDENYFMQYGSKILVPENIPEDGMPMQDVLSSQYRYNIVVEPRESDNVSFELFYRIAATSAITAQSLQVAEELFGEQKTQYKSSIIKTISPFTNEEILLLDTLHKIAADSGKYRSANIGRDINNAILNLNDGLQQKNLYAMLSEFAERNTKFLEYLASLDVNVMERLPKTGLIKSPKLEDTHKFHVLKDLLEKDKDETFLIVVNDFYAMKSLADALGVSYLSKQELKDEMAYQELLDGLFERQSIVIVTQDMIKSSLDLVQANRLVQYQLNTEVSDIIQTQNRINRIGQTRETKCFYIAADRLQNALIELFLDSYRNIRVAHKGIIELFADLSNQIDVINDYLDTAFKKLGTEENIVETKTADNTEDNTTDLVNTVIVPQNVQSADGICNAILFPEKDGISVIIPLKDGRPFRLGMLKSGIVTSITAPTRAMWNLQEMKLIS